MKKSILIVFIMAVFALSFDQLFAQDPILPPTPLGDCINLDDPLNVVAGHVYTYQVDVPTPPGEHYYTWFVTQSTQFIQNGGIVATIEPADGTSEILASGSGWYNVSTQSENTIELTWYSFILDPDEYVFVGIMVNEENGCSNNFKVFRIKPLHAFTLDIGNVNNTGADPVLAADEFAQCVSDVKSAEFDPAGGADGGIVYDFGWDSLYYVVAAANFSTGYEIYALFNGLQGPTPNGSLAETAMIYWDYTVADLETTSNSMAITNNTAVTLGTVVAQVPPVGALGEMIYIKVKIWHNHYELTANTNYTLAINGILTDDLGNVLAEADYGDIHYETCDQDGFTNDIITQVLNLRPTVNGVAPSAPVLPIAP